MESKNVYGWPVASGLKTDGTYTNDNNGVDTHLMKNIEWGAVAYLSKSQYGNANEIWNNSFNNYRTGCAGSGVNASYETTCNAYNTTDGMKASTTGNIYGIYDMSGGTEEHVAAHITSGHQATFGGSLANAEAKYKDVYPGQTGIYATTANKKGDAIWETSEVDNNFNRYNDYIKMPTYQYAWFIRGGNNAKTTRAGIFNATYTNGEGIGVATRPVLVVDEGL